MILEHVSCHLESDRLYALRGRSGSGKSTLLGLLGLLDRPTGGTYEIGGVDTSGLDDREISSLRGRVFGFVYQRFALVPHLNALDNVGVGLIHSGLRLGWRERRRTALGALTAVGLAERADHLPASLSGGEQQRVGIARALAKRPRFLLADEPTGALDETTADHILDLMITRAREEGAGMLLATHDPAIAERMTTRLSLDRGHLSVQADVAV